MPVNRLDMLSKISKTMEALQQQGTRPSLEKVAETLGFTTEEFRTVQRLLECIGISKTPTVARNSQHMVDLLTNNPNALGYLTRKELQGNPTKSKLKLIKVLAE